MSCAAHPRRRRSPPRGDYVMVEVADTGSGMSDETRAKAFEPFFTTKEVGKGSGLGLAQVYGFAKQSGGGVRIDTAPGEGTTVSVFLPRAAEDAVSAGEPRVAKATGSIAGRTVLVLDDEDAVRGVTADELREAGCRVIEAADGASALAALESERGIELVVADFAMPGMNGADFAARAHRALAGAAGSLRDGLCRFRGDRRRGGGGDHPEALCNGRSGRTGARGARTGLDSVR